MLKEIDHPFSRGEKVYDVTFENVQAGLRTDYLFRLATSGAASCWYRRPLRAGAGLVDIRCRRPDVALQRQRRRAQDTDPASDPLGHLFGEFDSRVGEVLRSVLDTEITPELVPADVGDELQSSEAKVGPYALQDFSLFQVLRYGFRPSKIAFLAWHAWSDPDQGDWPPGFPDDKRPSYSLTEIRHWLQVFVQRFYSLSQFKRSAMPTAPRCPMGFVVAARDWRAPSDMSGGFGWTRSSARCRRTRAPNARERRLVGPEIVWSARQVDVQREAA